MRTSYHFDQLKFNINAEAEQHGQWSKSVKTPNKPRQTGKESAILVYRK
ncbi:hypothetical protein PIIN_09781 [Serendipita indica DSM 11827]|uniref:Uncharacterized protein n=1 Tax=Serendipita indica (strain DSM 11827) TaxID=1109443 RepID=G4TWV0_SERID|nr:hypothetical protein PIIN_09781 [Serendipita indica DSM 11827]